MSRRVTATSRPKRKKRNPPKGGFFFGSSRITGVRALGFRPGMLWPLAPRPWLAFGFAGLGYAIALYTWASRGETLASTLAAQTVLRVREGKAAARPVYLFGLRPLTCAELASRVDTKVSHDDTVKWKESRWRCRRRPRPLPEPQGDADAAAGMWWRAPGCLGPSSRLCRRVGMPACLPTMPRRALARPTRTSRSGRVFGAHPRGEFRTSERP